MKQISQRLKKLPNFIFLFFCVFGFSQEFYFTDLGESTLNKSKAKTIVTLHKDKNTILLNAFLMLDKENALKIGHKKAKIINESTLSISVKSNNTVGYKMKREFRKIDNNTYLVKDYDNYGNINFIGKASSYFPLIKNGWGTTFYTNGQVATTGIYNNNKLILNENWTLVGEKSISNAHSLTNVTPKLKKNNENYISAISQYLQKTIKKSYKLFHDDELNYFRKHNLNVNFIVDTEGNIEVTNIHGKFRKKLKNDIESALKETSDLWSPGYIKDVAVNTKLSLPINIIAFNDYQQRSSDHINHWFFYNDMPVRLYSW